MFRLRFALFMFGCPRDVYQPRSKAKPSCIYFKENMKSFVFTGSVNFPPQTLAS